jgi:hypothetical protein
MRHVDHLVNARNKTVDLQKSRRQLLESQRNLPVANLNVPATEKFASRKFCHRI